MAQVPGSGFLGWIDEGDAADLIVPKGSSARHALEGWNGCDVIVQSEEHREKRLLVADMDSTMIGQECIDELADYAGIKPEVAAITERAMRGDLDFGHALAERVALLKGLDTTVIDRCLAERIRPSPGAGTLVRTMRARGANTLLVSGGFTNFVEPVAAQLGFDESRANVLEHGDGRLTGRTKGRIVDSAEKKSALLEVRERLGLSKDAVLAIGDGANDLPMIEAAGLGVAYRAKPVLTEAADAKLDHHGLDALLWAQGIPRREWVEG